MSCKLIAELSMNHGGDLDLAKKMIVSAKENGADYVKFQTWKYKNLKPGPWDTDGRRELYKQTELTLEKHIELKEFCDNTEIKFLTSCFSIDDIDFIRSLTDEVKIPSTECRNIYLVNKCIEIFNQVYISVGCSLFEEYESYIPYGNVCLLHCVSTYPCLPQNVNLSKLLNLKMRTQRFGYSGHMQGIWDAIAAISLGSSVVEKHFTIDQNLPFPDNRFAILPNELRDIREFIDTFDLMSRDCGLGYQSIENKVRELYSGRWA